MAGNDEFKKKLITRCFNFAKRTIALVDNFPNKRSAWIISDQLIRAATSIGANVIEAQAASSKKDFINFLNHSLKSGNEAKFWLDLAGEIAPKEEQEINSLLEEDVELTKILGLTISSLRRRTQF